jgi:2-polyprenyl-6-methoxyphenol hydroxylase-like FAD-dependent oxidoreductase
MEEQIAGEERYDVVIVGGRPAGASLAARLGARGMRVLVIDRAELPSLPGVPSCPVIYASAMRLLDELGIDEARFAAGSLKIRDFSIEFGTFFTVPFRMVEAHGRDYIYSIDRTSFDHALWEHLARYPSVTRRAGFAFVDFIRDERGRVIGIEGRAEGQPVQRIHAGCVVGADGRFSVVARKAGARITEDYPDRTSTVHFTDWEGIALPAGADGGPRVLLHATGRGMNIMFFPIAGGRVTICIHARSDRVDVAGDAEGYYLRTLRGIPAVARRIEGARMVGPLLGVKRVANRYHDFGGPGWVLAGDALHQKDPVDGQGIYDALVETKALDEAIAAWHAGTKTWEDALASYRARVLAETHGMFLATMERLKRELYDEPPEIVIRTLIRWMLHDPEYQRRFLLFLARAIPAENWLPPSLVPAAALRGALRDLRQLVRPRDRGERPGVAAG